MADVKWIKIATDIFDDEKILLIESMPEADAVIVIWFKLLCLAGKQNNSGVFTMHDRIAYTDEMFSTIFRRPLNTIRLALDLFERFGMVERINDAVTIPNWGKHQSFDKIEKNNEYMREYMREYRAKQAQKALPVECKTNGKPNSKANVSALEKNREDKNREDIGGKRKRFTPPSLDEVTGYITDKGYTVDPQSFIDFYESNGWKVGRNPMKDWKATIRTWNRRDNADKPAPDPNKGKTPYCPKCGSRVWRNTQMGTYFCESCRGMSISKGEVVWR